jgi:hypothetical protein
MQPELAAFNTQLNEIGQWSSGRELVMDKSIA